MNNPFRHRSAPAPDPAELRHQRCDQLAALADLADQATAIQPQADTAIRACGAPGTIPDAVAVDLGGLLRAYSRLHHQAGQMEVDPSLSGARRELQGLLSYHLHMLRDAGDLVFSGRTHAQTDRFRRELADGLGPHAENLERLRDRLAIQLTQECG
jgi:hypothetical protein